jgi:hypothetical protein
VIVTLKVWLRADDYDFDLLARMFAVGDTRFFREDARSYLTNGELDEAAMSGEVPREQAKSLLSRINGYAVVHDGTYHPIELDNRYTMPGEDEPRSVWGLGYLRILPGVDPETPMPNVAPAGFDLTKTDPDVTDVLTLLDRPHRGARWVELYDTANSTCVTEHHPQRPRRGRRSPTPRTARRRACPHGTNPPPHGHNSSPARTRRSTSTASLPTMTTGASTAPSTGPPIRPRIWGGPLRFPERDQPVVAHKQGTTRRQPL